MDIVEVLANPYNLSGKEFSVQCETHKEWVSFEVPWNLNFRHQNIILEEALNAVKNCPQCIAEIEAKKPKYLMWPEGAEL